MIIYYEIVECVEHWWFQVDDVDRLIVAALAEDGRRSYREIARSLQVSEGAVRQRVSRLIDEGLIRIAAIGNLNAMGFDVVAMVLVRVKPGTVDAVAGQLAKYPSVRFVAVLFGGADIVFQTLHNTLDELHGFVRNRVPTELPDIVSVETFPEVRTIKSSWDWNSWFSLQQGRSK